MLEGQEFFTVLEAQEFSVLSFAAFTTVIEAQENFSLLLKFIGSVFTLLEVQELLH